MKRGRKFLLYGATAAAALLFSLYARFPGEAVRDYLTAAAAASHPQLRFSAAEVRPALPVGLAFSEVAVAGRRQPETLLRLERLSLRPSLLSLFRGKLDILVAAEGYGGIFSGNAGFERLSPRRGPFSAKADLRGIRLEKAALLQGLLARPLSGTLGARVSFGGTGDLKTATGSCDFTVTNGVYPLSEKFLGLDRIDFTRVEGQLGLRNGILKVTRLSLTGEKIRCFLKGEIALADDLSASRLDLSGTLELPGQGNKRFTLTITGTVGSPQSRLM